MKIRLRYVVEDVDRHGNIRLYFRRKGQPKVRLPGPIGSPEFLSAYKAAVAGELKATDPVKGRKPLERISIRWLCAEYFQSAAFKHLDPRTQKVRRGILDRFCQNENDGEKPYALLQARHVRKRRDAMADRPEAANGLIKALRQLFKHAVEYDLVERNIAREIDYLSTETEGFHSWTHDEIRKFEETHAEGTMARLALALALYTAQRRSDLVRLGRQHIQNGWLVFTQHKNRNKKPIRMEIPVTPELQRIIDASPCGNLTFLVTAFGRPFTSNGFGNRFRKWCNEAGLPHCSAHGLRKAAAARLAELGRSEHEIMAITGHKTSKEVVRYTRAADQRVRAGRAMDGFEYGQPENKSVPLSEGVAKSGTKPAPK